jgi:hypothetical protein
LRNINDNACFYENENKEALNGNGDEKRLSLKSQVIAAPSQKSSTPRARSLEDILSNLNKYRRKFKRKSEREGELERERVSNVEEKSYARQEQSAVPLGRAYPRMFESSTWRVMRQTKSVDVRNKYPLESPQQQKQQRNDWLPPLGESSRRFKNSSIWLRAGAAAPQSTFLLHPDWI